MTGNANLWRRARSRWPLLALLVVLSPTLSGAAPPVDVSQPNPSALNRARDALPTDAFLSDGARRTHASSGKTRIGRIFFSPAERRHRYADKTPATDASSAAHAAGGERLEINGAISSSTQGRAVWVNGAAIENTAKFKSAWTDRAGSVWLRDDRRAPHLVRPGQAIDPTSGAMEDLLPAGSVVRR
jgi:hypothetical protein